MLFQNVQVKNFFKNIEIEPEKISLQDLQLKIIGGKFNENIFSTLMSPQVSDVQKMDVIHFLNRIKTNLYAIYKNSNNASCPANIFFEKLPQNIEAKYIFLNDLQDIIFMQFDTEQEMSSLEDMTKIIKSDLSERDFSLLKEDMLDLRDCMNICGWNKRSDTAKNAIKDFMTATAVFA